MKDTQTRILEAIEEVVYNVNVYKSIRLKCDCTNYRGTFEKEIITRHIRGDRFKTYLVIKLEFGLNNFSFQLPASNYRTIEFKDGKEICKFLFDLENSLVEVLNRG
jgi:hypothetical protein